MPQSLLASRLVRVLPFYYGWMILGAVAFACFARAGPAVATFSMFVTPMTADLGWSRTTLAGAVSLGGVLAAIFSPMIGSYLDRKGARVVLGTAVVATGLTLAALSTVESVLAFYVFYCIARMCWAGPFDLGIHGALNSWFVAKRGVAASLAQLAQAGGLVVMPQIGWWVTAAHGWRTGWLVVGIVVLVVGFLPAWLLMIRRPEDVGLVPDGGGAASGSRRDDRAGGDAGTVAPTVEEPSFTRAEALRTRAFWTLALFTALIFPVQAGLSLHQAAHLIERGLGPGEAATVVGVFSFASAMSGFGTGLLRNRISVKLALALAGLLLAASTVATLAATALPMALAGGILFGLGIGGCHVLLPIAWADYFGRRSYGAIRGVALTMQVAAQAAGPLASGVMRDVTGDYTASLLLFAGLSVAGALAALATRAPTR